MATLKRKKMANWLSRRSMKAIENLLTNQWKKPQLNEIVKAKFLLNDWNKFDLLSLSILFSAFSTSCSLFSEFTNLVNGHNALSICLLTHYITHYINYFEYSSCAFVKFLYQRG
jgi:hypothetical protein